MTREEIEAGRSPRGGWTRAQLAEWGVPWPPPKGWKTRLLRQRVRPPERPFSGQRTRLPFLATITAGGRTYEIEVGR